MPTIFQENKIFKKWYYFPFQLSKHAHAPTCCAVYFITSVDGLFETIEYVGSSKWLRSRICGHPVPTSLKKENKKVNIYFIPTKDGEQKELESFFIKELQPRINKVGK